MRVVNEIVNEPRPNVLFAGVQFLLMDEPEHELAGFYPNLSAEPAPPDGVDQVFRDFVLDRERDLIEIGRTRHTQTNEVRRCAALLSAIWETTVTTFHLVDLGSSAGLNLLMDRYHYRWDGLDWGPDSPVRIECALRGRAPSTRPIRVLSRTGLDLDPVDLGDPDARKWLEALIWPEQEGRRRLLAAAAELSRDAQLEMVAGDAVETLPTAIAALPGTDPVVVMHSFALNQLDPAQRDTIDRELSAAREERTVWRVSMELLDWRDEAPELTIDRGSGPTVVGRAQPHGEWLELL